MLWHAAGGRRELGVAMLQCRRRSASVCCGMPPVVVVSLWTSGVVSMNECLGGDVEIRAWMNEERWSSPAGSHRSSPSPCEILPDVSAMWRSGLGNRTEEGEEVETAQSVSRVGDAHPDLPNCRAPDVQCHNGWLVRPAKVTLCTRAMGDLMSLTSDVAACDHSECGVR